MGKDNIKIIHLVLDVQEKYWVNKEIDKPMLSPHKILGVLLKDYTRTKIGLPWWAST